MDEMVTRYCVSCGETIHVHRDSDSAYGEIRCDDGQGCDSSPADSVTIYFDREDGTSYSANFKRNEPIMLREQVLIRADMIQVGDEIESHYSAETDGIGHIVTEIVG